MKKWISGAAALLGLLTISEMGSAAYFYRRTMKRSNAKKERTVKMAGTDWNQYMPLIQERKAYMLAQLMKMHIRKQRMDCGSMPHIFQDRITLRS